jgi:hypothetical protein
VRLGFFIGSEQNSEKYIKKTSQYPNLVHSKPETPSYDLFDVPNTNVQSFSLKNGPTLSYQ